MDKNNKPQMTKKEASELASLIKNRHDNGDLTSNGFFQNDLFYDLLKEQGYIKPSNKESAIEYIEKQKSFVTPTGGVLYHRVLNDIKKKVESIQEVD